MNSGPISTDIPAMPTETIGKVKNSGILTPLSICGFVLVLGNNKLNRLIGATAVFYLYISLLHFKVSMNCLNSELVVFSKVVQMFSLVLFLVSLPNPTATGSGEVSQFYQNTWQ